MTQETPAFLTTVNGQIYSTDGVPVDLKVPAPMYVCCHQAVSMNRLTSTDPDHHMQGVAYFGFDDDTTAPGVIGTSFLDGFWEVRQ